MVNGINILEKTGDPDSLKEELGDLLLQVVMHAAIAEEEGLFTMDDVISCVSEKMIRLACNALSCPRSHSIRSVRRWFTMR